ncbi:MAG: peptidylprolyl isomerase [Muribaculaceae bacterium]|nr:peptidylprolyl isomerase [Muribaculaceae bacterium]
MAEQTKATNNDAKVLIHTSEGDIEVLLYGDTPKHQENFLKLAKEGYYDGTLFHRVINEFMVQAGDPDSKGAAPDQHLGQGGPGYQIDAEIVYPRHFHKRGALAAARTADQINPERKSSGSQFYIVTGKKYTDAELNQMEQQMKMGEMQSVFYKLAGQRQAEIQQMQAKGDREGLQQLQEQLIAEAEKQVSDVKLTDAQRQAYTTVGGTPFLDNQYTVFGEVTKGMDIVEKIEKTKTGAQDRPVADIKILSTEILK